MFVIDKCLEQLCFHAVWLNSEMKVCKIVYFSYTFFFITVPAVYQWLGSVRYHDMSYL